MTLGSQIAQLRRERDWTQDLLASKVGVHVRHVSRWETGRHKPPPKMLQKLSEAFGVPLQELQASEQRNTAPNLSDPELLEDVQLLQELDSNDRATVRQVIRAFATKRRVAQLVVNG